MKKMTTLFYLLLFSVSATFVGAQTKPLLEEINFLGLGVVGLDGQANLGEIVTVEMEEVKLRVWYLPSPVCVPNP